MWLPMADDRRTCPVCREALEEIPLGDHLLDRCPVCQGLFFDAGELESLVRLAHLLSEVRLDEPEIDAAPAEEVAREVLCPADGAAMSPEDLGGVTIDVCPSCRGIWLDGGELAAIKLAESNIRAHLELYERLGS